jgi:hypothetical protein
LKATNENIRTKISRIIFTKGRWKIPVILAEESVVHQKEIRAPEVPFEAVKNGTLETI